MKNEDRIYIPFKITKEGSIFVKPIPITAAERIAEEYDYDQVIVIARKVGATGGEHVTTYGIDKPNCDVAARIGNYLKYEIMNWVRPPQD